MDEIISWLNPRIPIGYVLCSSIVLSMVICIRLFFFKSRGVKRFVTFSLLAEYYFLVLCSTVICRTAKVTYRFDIRPFRNYEDIWDKTDYPRDLLEVLLNIALFIPIGFLASLSIRNSKWYQVLGIGVILSLVIELSQLLTQRGLCETDDVLHNTLGAMIGYGVYLYCYSLKQRLV